MTDHFALFGEARRPWLDAEKLKEKYFALSRSAPATAEVNEAFRILSDPKLRLRHFLQLQGADLTTNRPVPAALAELFWKTGTLLREIDRWLLRETAATSALARAVLQPERQRLESSLGELEEELRAVFDGELRQLSNPADLPNDYVAALLARYDSISYLSRLLEQISEKRLQLTVR